MLSSSGTIDHNSLSPSTQQAQQDEEINGCTTSSIAVGSNMNCTQTTNSANAKSLSGMEDTALLQTTSPMIDVESHK